MSRCKFSIAIKGNMQKFLELAETQLKAAGGSIEGDKNSGSIIVDTPIGTILGIYTAAKDSIQIYITRKPQLLSCVNIRALVADALGVEIADLS